VGYLNFSGKKGYASSGIVPAMAGIKYLFSESKVYLSGQLGVAFSTESGGGSNFTYAPGIGYNISENVDVNLKYTGYSFKGGGTGGVVGVRLAYSF
jgi:hypothetical protein